MHVCFFMHSTDPSLLVDVAGFLATTLVAPRLIPDAKR